MCVRSPVWTRHLSNPPDVDVEKKECDELREVIIYTGVSIYIHIHM